MDDLLEYVGNVLHFRFGLEVSETGARIIVVGVALVAIGLLLIIAAH